MGWLIEDKFILFVFPYECPYFTDDGKLFGIKGDLFSIWMGVYCCCFVFGNNYVARGLDGVILDGILVGGGGSTVEEFRVAWDLKG